MSYPDTNEERRRRSQKLVNGKCDCGSEAQIPWKGYKLCYHCWNLLQNALRESERKNREN